MSDSGTMSGRVAVITGGLSGIGLACAKGLQASGAQVCVGARRAGDAAKLSAFHAELGDDAYAAALDVTDQESVADKTAPLSQEALDTKIAALDQQLETLNRQLQAQGIALPKNQPGDTSAAPSDTSRTDSP